LPGDDIPLEVLHSISAKISAEYDEIDLVLYDMTGKPPATIEWE
jgi:GMP synthase PP-ATPase subunit